MKRLAILALLFSACVLAQNPATAVFPGAVATDTTLGVLCNSAHTKLTASVGASDLTFQVADGSKLCAPGWVTIDSNTPAAEVVKVCSKSDNTVGVCAGGRAAHGSAVPHGYGALVDGFIDSNYHNQTAAEVKAVQAALGTNLANVVKRDANGNATLANVILGPKTIGGGVNQLPAALAGNAGWITVVTDAASNSDCTVGGGSYASLCRSNGATWQPIGGGGGSGLGFTPLNPANNLSDVQNRTTALSNLGGVPNTDVRLSDARMPLAHTHTGSDVTTAVATATALAANGLNCPAGQVAAGVDSSGNAEGCTTTINGTAIPASKTLMATDAAVSDIQIPAKYKRRTCEIHIWGSGASQVLQDTDDEPASCFNDSGVQETITAVRCWANSGSPTVTPIITGGATNSILTGALTCGTAVWQSGALNGTPTLDNGGTIDANTSAAGGVATNIRLVITLTR